MYPDILGEFIMTLIDKGFKVIVDTDPIINGVMISVIKYEPEPCRVVRRMSFDELNSMSKDVQKSWFDNFIEWAEVEFLKFRRGNKND